ncbi:Preprotein translocase subunit YajC (TC 3.A.5.1.1) [hydrothermal vent metagenome]|uniref:Preprotein translocase subunit YajC (TC 3.A.5.1.1) n=1 Tax=hydrothermal vent metagenome TaxID=652676 RepID=A0A3B1EA24_9ZZZZ
MESQGSLIGSLLPLVVLFAIFYFLIIRPQQKQQKEHNAMMDSLTKGDQIVTNGGLIVEIIKVEPLFYNVKNTDGTIMKVAKKFVSSKWEI